MKALSRYGRVTVSLIAVLVFLSAGSAAWSQKPQQRSVNGLIFDLRHPDAERRKEAAMLLGQNGIREAVPELMRLEDDADASVRLEVARALVKIRDPRALPTFTKLLRDSETGIQKVAVEGVVTSYVVEPGGFIDGVSKVVNFLNPLSDGYNPLIVEPYVPVSAEAVTALGDLLFSGDRGLRKDAAVALGILRGRGALSAIKAALESEDSNDVKVELIRAVYKIGDQSAGVAVIPLIRDPDKKVHDEAILTVGRLRVSEATPSLNELYQAGIEERRKVFGILPVSGSDDLQKNILEALAFIGDPQSASIFQAALTDERDFYRRYGAEGLGRIGDQSVVQNVATLYMREGSGSVKLAMSFALFKLGRGEHLIELVQNIKNDQAYYYLMEMGPAEIAQLYPYVRMEKNPTKARLLDIIGMKGDSSGIAVAEEFATHENSDVASAANLAIRRLRARFP